MVLRVLHIANKVLRRYMWYMWPSPCFSCLTGSLLYTSKSILLRINCLVPALYTVFTNNMVKITSMMDGCKSD